MAKKKKSSTPSARRQKQLFKSHEGSQGQKIYNVTAGQVKASEVKWMVNTINRRLKAIEKAGLQEESNEYKTIAKYAISDPNGRGAIYNVNMDKGTIRLSRDMRGMTGAEKAYLINVARNIMQAKTGTVKGTRAALKKAYGTALAATEKTESEMTYEQYVNVWRAYRRNVAPDKRDHESSQIVMQLIKQTNFYELTPDQLDKAFGYLGSFETPADWADELVSESPFNGDMIKIEYT